MKKVLITYATREGQTEKVASRIREHLSTAGANVTLINAKDALARQDLDLESFDLLVFGASIHAGSLEKEIVGFVERHAQEIAAKDRSFFLVLLSAAAEDPEMREKWLGEVREKFDEQLAVRFADLEMIAGALAYTRYAFPVRWLMKRIARQAGHSTDTSRDHEFTNWDQVSRYAQRLLQVQAEPESDPE